MQLDKLTLSWFHPPTAVWGQSVKYDDKYWMYWVKHENKTMQHLDIFLIEQGIKTVFTCLGADRIVQIIVVYDYVTWEGKLPVCIYSSHLDDSY